MFIFLIFTILFSAAFGEEINICVKKEKGDSGINELIEEEIALKELELFPFSCHGSCPCLCDAPKPIDARVSVLDRSGTRKTLIVKHSEDVYVEAKVNWGDNTETERFILKPSKGGALVHNYRVAGEYDVAMKFDGNCRELTTEKIKISV